jgi:hypothetical protein
MTHPNASKGKAAERAVAQYLRDNGYPFAGRMRSGWLDDKGDIENVPETCVEVKAEKRIDLAGYMVELEREMTNAKADTGVVIIKKRGTSNVGQWYACAPVHIWIQLLKESGR